jgi:hypothetical protein
MQTNGTPLGRAMTKQVTACCSSPAAMCYWFVASLIAWGVLSLIGIYWRPLHASSAGFQLTPEVSRRDPFGYGYRMLRQLD